MEKIEDRIDKYIESNISEELDGIDEGAADVLWRATKGSFKGIASITEKGFDLLSRKISDGLQSSAFETNMNKIAKLKNKEKRIKQLQKQAEFHKESFVRIVYRIEDEMDKNDDYNDDDE